MVQRGRAAAVVPVQRRYFDHLGQLLLITVGFVETSRVHQQWKQTRCVCVCLIDDINNIQQRHAGFIPTRVGLSDRQKEEEDTPCVCAHQSVFICVSSLLDNNRSTALTESISCALLTTYLFRPDMQVIQSDNRRSRRTAPPPPCLCACMCNLVCFCQCVMCDESNWPCELFICITVSN